MAGTANIMRDPLQGYDIQVTVSKIGDASNTPLLVGGFNTFMWRVVNQTNAYITLNSRIPRMLDGTVITVWSLSQGLVDLNVVVNSFGQEFATQFAAGRTAIIPRATRFNLTSTAGFGTTINSNIPTDDSGFNLGGGSAPNMSIKLGYARIDTLTFGVQPGGHPAVNSWQGTAESINDGTTSA